MSGEVEGAADFLHESEEVAEYFLALYLDEEGKERSLVSMSPAQNGAAPDPTLPVPTNLAALEIAQRLRTIGDQLNQSLRKELLQDAFRSAVQEQNILEVTLEQFRGMCSHVLRSSVVETGWQQVAAVHLVMGHLVRELRVQAPPNREHREAHYRRYVGTYLQDTGLSRWIGEQGGYNHMAQPARQGTRPQVNLDANPLD